MTSPDHLEDALAERSPAAATSPDGAAWEQIRALFPGLEVEAQVHGTWQGDLRRVAALARDLVAMARHLTVEPCPGALVIECRPQQVSLTLRLFAAAARALTPHRVQDLAREHGAAIASCAASAAGSELTLLLAAAGPRLATVEPITSARRPAA